MKKILALCAALSVVGGLSAIAAPKHTTPVKHVVKKQVKLIDVWTCPITMSKTSAKTQAGSAVVGHFRVHFCCGGCPQEFAKLSPKEKMAKAEAAYKKDHPVKSKKK